MNSVATTNSKEEAIKFKYKVGEYVYLQTGWYPGFKFKITDRYNHHGDPLYLLDYASNKSWEEAQMSLHGTDASINWGAQHECNLSRKPFTYKNNVS